MKRRDFLRQSGWYAGGTIVALGSHAWVAQAAQPQAQPKRLVVVFLRGAADGLNIVIPYQDVNYYANRPKIAIPKPGTSGGCLDLDGRFGLHPALQPLMPLWKQGDLAFVHACGSPDTTRSHFDAQDYMESGTPGLKRTSDGWMNRLLTTLSDRTPIQAINVGSTTPRILTGPMPVATLSSGRRSTRPLPIDRPSVSSAFDKLYAGNDALSQTYREGQEARRALMQDLQTEMKQADNGAPLPDGFASDARRLARLMVNDRRIELAFLDIGGWDTHINQGASQGQLARRLSQLGQGLAALAAGLKPIRSDTVVLVMSEFGRTLRENGNAGTDHGHGNVMWLLGGSVKGGQVHGDWPGLADRQLHEGRDLAITTDFRSVIATVLTRHMGLNRTQIGMILPGYPIPTALPLLS